VHYAFLGNTPLLVVQKVYQYIYAPVSDVRVQPSKTSALRKMALFTLRISLSTTLHNDTM